MSDATPSPTLGHLRLSAARDKAPDPPAASPTENRHKFLDGDALAGTKVLLVDDDCRNLFAIKATLERTKAAQKLAGSDEDALYTVERTPKIDIVLMDIMMPDIDGHTAVRKIRTTQRHASLPVIAVTAKVNADERERCLDSGANDYVPKPVNTAELLNAIQRWLPDENQASA